MESKTYQWAKGARTPKGVRADDAAAELERIRTERGRLTSDDLLEESSSPDALLHGAFEWDDSVAGHYYRKNQASKLIRAVVTVKAADKPEHRSYVLVKPDDSDEASYVPMTLVVQRPDLFDDGLARLRAELQSAHASVNEMLSLASADDRRRERMSVVSQHVGQAAEALEAV
jgi:hypothetical protein